MQSEGANSPADVFITVDAGRLAQASGLGLLQPIEVARCSTRASRRTCATRTGSGTGWPSARACWSTPRTASSPAQLSTYEALADPAFKGKVLVRSSTNVYNLSLVGSILAADGPEATETWCEGLVANMARPPEGGDTDQLKAVAAGVGDVAISNTYYLARLKASAKPEEQAIGEQLAVFFPNQGDRGTHVNVSGAGVLKTAPNHDNAVKLIEYLASPEAQRYFADVSLEYPANPEVEAAPGAGRVGRVQAGPAEPRASTPRTAPRPR